MVYLNNFNPALFIVKSIYGTAKKQEYIIARGNGGHRC